MPNASLHLDEVALNERLLLTFPIETTPYLRWVVTISFYTALHYIDYHLARHHNVVDPGSHQGRLRYIEKDPHIFGLSDRFEQLLNESLLARYACKPYAPEKVQQLMSDVLTQIKPNCLI